jgi:hypothetical protein
MCASRQDLNREHATLVTDWALPQLRADEFFITLTIILGTFEGRWFRRLHVQKLSTVRQFLLSVPVGQETVSSGCADLSGVKIQQGFQLSLSIGCILKRSVSCEIENLPVADNTADVVISNCVINLFSRVPLGPLLWPHQLRPQSPRFVRRLQCYYEEV